MQKVCEYKCRQRCLKKLSPSDEEAKLLLHMLVVFSRFYAYVYRGVTRDSPPREGTEARLPELSLGCTCENLLSIAH